MGALPTRDYGGVRKKTPGAKKVHEVTSHPSPPLAVAFEGGGGNFGDWLGEEGPRLCAPHGGSDPGRVQTKALSVLKAEHLWTWGSVRAPPSILPGPRLSRPKR